ncbi:MAG TPA: hypothetical protein VJV05_01635 [Pyrinomonadaceae bacterium]|nr:hypothetical protein [Pyrinomonadaceae bacterium]
MRSNVARGGGFAEPLESAFSVSSSNLRRVEEYIRNQKEHHRRRDFKSEFRGLLKKHDVEYDERYVWD